MCVFELVLCGDEEGGEVLGEEPGEGRRVGEQDLRKKYNDYAKPARRQINFLNIQVFLWFSTQFKI